MATTPKTVDYPTGDGRPLAETPIHRDNLLGLIEVLRRHFAGAADVYISGNMMMYYVEGDTRRHVSPDVFLVRGIRGANDRDAYFVWEEGKGPDFVVEFTSKSTRREDLRTKFELYRDVLHVSEYFLFDPKQEYLKPSMQGFRLVEGRYEPIEPVDGRLPSVVTGLHLERDGTTLRMYNPATGRWVLPPSELMGESEALVRAAQAQALEALEVAQRAIERADGLQREVEELRAQLRQRNGH